MTSKQFVKDNFGIGATKELSLRVSVGTLIGVVFTNPESGDLTLALERKVTLLADKKRAVVKAQPFGGAIRINDPTPLLELTGGFHFDSIRSRAEQDFRILIRPAVWHIVRDFCLEHFKRPDDLVLESLPVRELVEEFEDALGLRPRPDQYDFNLLYTVLENEPTPTLNIYSVGQPTVRIYRVFEARMLDPALLQTIRLNSQRYSDQDLQDRALEDFRNGGRGRANAFLTLPVDSLRQFYLSISPERRNSAILFGKIDLDGNVPALLNGIPVPKFKVCNLSDLIS